MKNDVREAGSNSGAEGKSLAGRMHCKYHRMEFSHLKTGSILPEEKQKIFREMCISHLRNENY